MSQIEVERSIDCLSSAEQLWPVITDTERLNRAIGLGRLEVIPNSDDSAARYLIKTVAAGFPLEYEERPFEWQHNRRFAVRRVVRKGLTSEIENRFALTPLKAGGTRLSMSVRLAPKVGLLRPVMALQVRRTVARVLKEFAAIDAELHAGHQAEFSSFVPSVGADALDRAADTLRQDLSSGANAERSPGHQGAQGSQGSALTERLIQWVRTAADSEVDRIRPFELADRWGCDRRELLELCLAAVNAGVLQLSWDLVCPSCRASAERLASLVELNTSGHCQFCDIDYDLDLDQAVEASFSPASAVRKIDVGPYCIGGPARTPHVLSQAILYPHGNILVEAPSTEGRYRLFVRGGATRSLLVKPGAPDSVQLTLRDEQFDSEAELEIALGGSLEVNYVAEHESHIKLETLVYRDQAATAHFVSTLATFRRRFASQLLRPGLSLKVGRVSLLFTDLTDSTALYSLLGDARAFRVVLDHFDLLRGVVTEHDGSIVKTIGDAVMAAFVDERDAVACAVAMHRAMAAFREAQPDAAQTRLKIGVFTGPCYSVNANDNLDYFGQSVNIAARLQGAAASGELVLTAKTAALAEHSGWLGGASVGQRFSAELKGVDGAVELARVLVDG